MQRTDVETAHACQIFCVFTAGLLIVLCARNIKSQQAQGITNRALSTGFLELQHVTLCLG